MPHPPSDREVQYDAVLKDLFQSDSPSLLGELAGGRRIAGSLNVEFARVTERRADLAFLLEGGEILHLDFQSYNDPKMPYREGVYGLMIAEKYRCRRLRQVVLYAGRARLRMRSRLDLGGIAVTYRLIDIRELDAGALLRSRRPGDCVLALLARGGRERLRRIVRQAQRYPGAVRQKVVAQLLVLSGLRRLSTEVTMEMMRAGIERTIDEHAFLRSVWQRGEAEGVERGRAEALRSILTDLLTRQFGPPSVATRRRVDRASADQLEAWYSNLKDAKSVTAVFRKS